MNPGEKSGFLDARLLTVLAELGHTETLEQIYGMVAMALRTR